MSNQGIKESNKRRIALTAKFASMRKNLKEQIRLSRISGDINKTFKLQQQLDRLPRNSNPTRIRNICLITNRCRGMVLYKHFGMCGFKIREFANKGLIPGVRKR